jgi:hypothetical protein
MAEWGTCAPCEQQAAPYDGPATWNVYVYDVRDQEPLGELLGFASESFAHAAGANLARYMNKWCSEIVRGSVAYRVGRL